MLTIQEYVKAESLEQAYELNQKKTNRIIGGMLWMKMSPLNIRTAIDLSGLGLDKIEETPEEFRIGCMVSLRQLELHPGLAAYTQGSMKESVRHIVGVQFRNCATIGGSIWGRFGFSDPLTLFLSLGAEVVLHKAGVVALADFVNMPYDRDILVEVRLPKRGQKAAYVTHRASATDFPVLAVAVCRTADQTVCAVGARPQRAALVVREDGEAVQAFADRCADTLTFSSNLRGSAEYRAHLCRVLVRRAALAIEED